MGSERACGHPSMSFKYYQLYSMYILGHELIRLGLRVDSP